MLASSIARIPGTPSAAPRTLLSRSTARWLAQAASRGVPALYTYTDRTLSCVDCGTEFVFTASDQQFYGDRQFSEPRRCPACRAARKAARGDSAGSYAGSGGGYGDRPREMFTTTCDSCGREARVPFRPTGSKPVYCSDCFRR